jgi:hypothetical protein
VAEATAGVAGATPRKRSAKAKSGGAAGPEADGDASGGGGATAEAKEPGSEGEGASSGSEERKVKKRKPRKRDHDPEFSGGRKVVVDPKASNPIPDFIDPITMAPVVCPALSPFGHVLGYDTWCKVLREEPKNTCPFTKKPLTRRDLIKLTTENFEELKSKLLNV